MIWNDSFGSDRLFGPHRGFNDQQARRFVSSPIDLRIGTLRVGPPMDDVTIGILQC